MRGERKMTPEIVKRMKSYLRIIVCTLILSAIFVYFTCLFNDVPVSQMFINEETRWQAWFAIGGNLFLIATCALSVGMNFAPLPKLPGGPWEREQLIVCRYSGLLFGGIALMFFGLGMVAAYGCYLDIVDPPANSEDGALVFGMMAALFLGVACVFILYMKNYLLIFYPDGVLFQNMFGKTYIATNEQIEYVSIIPGYKERSLRLHTLDKDLWIDWNCSEFHEAERYALGRFTDFATYLKQQEAAQNQ